MDSIIGRNSSTKTNLLTNLRMAYDEYTDDTHNRNKVILMHRLEYYSNISCKHTLF